MTRSRRCFNRNTLGVRGLFLVKHACEARGTCRGESAHVTRPRVSQTGSPTQKARAEVHVGRSTMSPWELVTTRRRHRLPRASAIGHGHSQEGTGRSARRRARWHGPGARPGGLPCDTAKLSVATILRKAAHDSISAAGRVRASDVVAGCAYRIGRRLDPNLFLNSYAGLMVAEESVQRTS